MTRCNEGFSCLTLIKHKLCTSVDFGDNTLRSFMLYDTSSVCFGVSHRLWVLLVSVPSLVVVLGFVGVMLRLMCRSDVATIFERQLQDRGAEAAEQSEQSEQDGYFVASYAYLFKGYRIECAYWYLSTRQFCARALPMGLHSLSTWACRELVVLLRKLTIMAIGHLREANRYNRTHY